MPEIQHVGGRRLWDTRVMGCLSRIVPKDDFLSRFRMFHPPSQAVRVPVEAIYIETFGGIVVLDSRDGARCEGGIVRFIKEVLSGVHVFQGLPIVVRPIVRIEYLSCGQVDGTSHSLEFIHIIGSTSPGTYTDDSGVGHQPFKVYLAQAIPFGELVGKIAGYHPHFGLHPFYIAHA